MGSVNRPGYSQYRTLIHAIQEDDFLRKRPNVRPQWGDPVDHLIRFSDNRYLLDQVSVHANGDIVVSPYIPLAEESRDLITTVMPGDKK